ncbi:MAG: type II toxin-antitoxin system VapC family toxin [bacterium]
MILDSAFLVDFEREIQRKEHGSAGMFLQSNGDEVLCITFTIAGELAAGESLEGDHEKWEAFLSPFRFLSYTPEVGWRFGIIYRRLRAAGMLIGANDLWIAATALAYGQPLVTRNASDFQRIDGLEVHGY